MDLRSGAHANDALVERIRRRIVAAVHRGDVRVGDKLLSSRSLGEELGADHRAVARAYRRVAELGMVEIRARSGVYLASPDPPWCGDSKSDYTALWMRELGTEAWLRRIPLPALASVVGDFFSGRTLSAVFVESARDPLEAVAHELERDFGLAVRQVLVLPPETPAVAPPDEGDELVAAVAATDLVVTSAFHTPRVRQAMELGSCTPELVQMTLNHEWLATLRRAAVEEGLVVVGVDAGSEVRFRIALDVGGSDFRFTTLDRWRADPDPGEALVHATRAARTRDPELAEIAVDRLPPVLSMETARSVSGAIVKRQFVA